MHLFWFVATLLYSLERPPSHEILPGQELIFESFSWQEGLVEDTITALIQDSYGFLWVGTTQGLYRFDGYTFHTYKPDPNWEFALAGPHVRDLLLDRKGRLWVATGKGLDRYDVAIDGFRHYRRHPEDPNSLLSNDILCLAEDLNGHIWMGSQGEGMCRLDPETNQVERIPYGDGSGDEGLRCGLINDITVRKDGLLWLATCRGLHLYNPKNRHFKVYRHNPQQADQISDNMVQRVLVDGNQRTWVATRSGIDLFDEATGSFKNYIFQENHTYYALLQDRHGNIWAGGLDAGLGRLKPNEDQFVFFRRDPTQPRGLNDNRIFCLLEDRSGLLWIGTSAGLNYHNMATESFGTIRSGPASISHNRVNTVLHHTNGSLWIGTLKGLDMLRPGGARFETYNFSNRPDGECRVHELYEDHQGNVWVGTSGFGAYKFQDGDARWERMGPAQGLSSDRVLAFCEDQNKNLWVATGQGIQVRKADTPVFTTFPTADKTLNFTTSILVDSNNGLWLGGVKGLSYIPADRTGVLTYTAEGHHLPHNQVNHLFEDRKGRLWVGTVAGLAQVLPGQATRFEVISENDGLPGNAVQAITSDEEGYLWLATNSGLARYHPETRTFHNYFASDGLPGNEFIAGAVGKAPNGTIYLGTPKGLVYFHPEALLPKGDGPTPLVLTNFRLVNQELSTVYRDPDSPLESAIHAAKDIVLPADSRSFSVKFAALDFATAAWTRYAYRLDGLDQVWNEVSARDRIASYTNLPGGSYTFRVKALKSDGNWIPEEARLKIEVMPPIWHTWWAKALYVIIPLLGLLAYARANRLRLKQLDQVVSERTQQLKSRNQELEQARGRLETQARKLALQTQELKQLDVAKTRFFTNISHEFRTPLTLMMGPLEDMLAGRHGELQEGSERQVQRALTNTRKLRHLIDQLLEAARLEAGGLVLQAAPVDLVAMSRLIIQSFDSLAERGQVALCLESDHDSLQVELDRDKIEKVQANLISNALKFTAAGGTVRVVIGCDEKEAFLRVIDTGIGIDPEDLKHVFDRFFQAEKQVSGVTGSGIGLSLTRDLVHLHKGRIEVTSTPGEGSCFAVTLPLRQESSAMANVARSEDEFSIVARKETLIPPENNEERELVLLVEDKPDVREYLLENLGLYYEVLTAPDGEAGIELAREKIPDLIISDVMMPKRNGFELTATLKQDTATNHVPILLLTARSAHEARIEGLSSGADDYLVKPFNTEELLLRVHNLLATRKNLREHLLKGVLTPERGNIVSEDQVFLEDLRESVEKLMEESRCTVQELAAAVGFSRRQLHRKLVAITGITPADFLRRYRMERAAQLLEGRAANVSGIAYQLGFTNPRQFSTAFKDTYGVTPTAYAKGERDHPTEPGIAG